MAIEQRTHQNTRQRTGITSSPWRTVGFGLSVILILYILYNTSLALVNPAAFARGFGLASAADNPYLAVYAIRALFLGVYGAVLVVRRDFRALMLFLLLAVVMPLGDAALLIAKDASLVSVIKALVTAIILFGVAWLLWMGERAARQP
jgi:hypothetical protein